MLDALSIAGGITNDGRYDDVIISRRQADGEYGPPAAINVRYLLEKGTKTVDVRLNTGDVVYVRNSNMSKAGLFLQRIAPGIQLMNIGANLFGTFNQATTLTTTTKNKLP